MAGKDVWLETSFSLDWMPPAQAVALIQSHSPQRILFGTDSPWADQAKQIQLIRRLPLPDEQKTAILGGNAERLLGELS